MHDIIIVVCVVVVSYLTLKLFCDVYLIWSIMRMACSIGGAIVVYVDVLASTCNRPPAVVGRPTAPVFVLPPACPPAA
jgi:hypothetical protein